MMTVKKLDMRKQTGGASCDLCLKPYGELTSIADEGSLYLCEACQLNLVGTLVTEELLRALLLDLERRKEEEHGHEDCEARENPES